MTIVHRIGERTITKFFDYQAYAGLGVFLDVVHVRLHDVQRVLIDRFQ